VLGSYSHQKKGILSTQLATMLVLMIFVCLEVYIYIKYSSIDHSGPSGASTSNLPIGLLTAVPASATVEILAN